MAISISILLLKQSLVQKLLVSGDLELALLVLQDLQVQLELQALLAQLALLEQQVRQDQAVHQDLPVLQVPQAQAEH
jgi:hypothetical protein